MKKPLLVVKSFYEEKNLFTLLWDQSSDLSFKIKKNTFCLKKEKDGVKLNLEKKQIAIPFSEKTPLGNTPFELLIFPQMQLHQDLILNKNDLILEKTNYPKPFFFPYIFISAVFSFVLLLFLPQSTPHSIAPEFVPIRFEKMIYSSLKASAKIENKIQKFTEKQKMASSKSLFKTGLTGALKGLISDKMQLHSLTGKNPTFSAQNSTLKKISSSVDSAAFEKSDNPDLKTDHRYQTASSDASIPQLDLIAEENIETSQGLTQSQIGKIIHDHLSEIQYCQQTQLSQQKNQDDSLTLSFTINPSGHVTRTQIKETNNPELSECIQKSFLRWKFPQPLGGVFVDVSYPFLFRTLN